MPVSQRTHRIIGPRLLALLCCTAMACSERPSHDDDPIPAAVRAYAHARCQRLHACDCRITSYDSAQQCEDRIVFLYQETVEGRDPVDLDCFAEAARLWEQAPCNAPPEEQGCNVLEPAGPPGEPCHLNPFRDDYLRSDSCAEGTFCWNDAYCVEPPEATEDGAPCTPEGLCGFDLTCIAGRCEQRRTQGEPCEKSNNCTPAGELYCHEGTCTTKAAPGAPCMTAEGCRSSNAHCIDGFCVSVEPIICFAASF